MEHRGKIKFNRTSRSNRCAAVANCTSSIQFERRKSPNLHSKESCWYTPGPVASTSEKLKTTYKGKRFKYLYKQLERKKLTSLISKDLMKFFIKKLKNRHPENVIIVLHIVHSLISYPLAIPRTIAEALACDKFLSRLFAANNYFHYTSFCFMTLEILSHISYEVFHKITKKIWLPVFFKILYDMFRKESRTFSACLYLYFSIISCFLAIGIEAIPPKFYPLLKHYFETMLFNSSRNQLSVDAMLKAWDTLLLFCHNWVKYTLCYPLKDRLDPSFSMIKFKDCVSPDLSILENTDIRDKLKYKFIHVRNSYVPCVDHSQPSLVDHEVDVDSDTDKSYSADDWSDVDLDKSSSVEGTEDEEMRELKIYCEECKKYNKCSCVEDYLAAYSMKIDKNEVASSDKELQMRFDPSDEDMIPKKS